MTVQVYGASDDLIEMDGDVYEEFNYRNDPSGDYVAFSNGVIIRIELKDVWRITTVAVPEGTRVDVVQAPHDDDDNYSDVATITGGSILWAVHGINYARAKK